MSAKEEQLTSTVINDDKNAESDLSDEEATLAEGEEKEKNDDLSKDFAALGLTDEESTTKNDDLSQNIAALGLTDEGKPTKPEGDSDSTTPHSKDENTKPDPNDETSTPRLTTYISLHNDVRSLPNPSHYTNDQPPLTENPQMMTSKSAPTTKSDQQAKLYHHASHVARTLLASHAKHNDLPLVMHAHVCMVLGCSDDVDSFEMMERALELVGQAVEEEVLGRKEAVEMKRTCEAVMGMKERVVVGSDDEESEGSGEEGEGKEDEGGDDSLP